MPDTQGGELCGGFTAGTNGMVLLSRGIGFLLQMQSRLHSPACLCTSLKDVGTLYY